MRISDWSSDVCSSDLAPLHLLAPPLSRKFSGSAQPLRHRIGIVNERVSRSHRFPRKNEPVLVHVAVNFPRPIIHSRARSEEHTSELQSLMRISYASFSLKNNKQKHTPIAKQLIHN